MAKYHQHLRQQPQVQPIFGREKEMVRMESGGYGFNISDWERMERFLIIGSEGGTYYVDERALTVQNAQSIIACLKDNWKKAIDMIVEISVSGRAAKNDPAIFALSMASSEKYNPSSEGRAYALSQLGRVCRIGTHLFTFVTYVNSMRGWGRSLRRAIANWYTRKQPHNLAYQMAKYQQRGGWSHHDLMHLSHPGASSELHALLYEWAKNGWNGETMTGHDALLQLEGMEYIKGVNSVRDAVRIITHHKLSREMIPTTWLNEAGVWEALLPNMGITALVRNLAKMTAVGLVAPLSDATRYIRSVLTDQERIVQSRIHPFAVLNAHVQYASGHGLLGSLSWTPVQTVVASLDDAFELAFRNVVPTGKRICLGIDVSGSMNNAFIVSAIRGGAPVRTMKAATAAAAMAMITARSEQDLLITLFNTRAVPAAVHANSSLDVVTRSIEHSVGGGTDYSAPIKYCLGQKNPIPVDAFVIYGDEQSWAGAMHASQSIGLYRQKTGIATKLIVCNFCAYNITVRDNQDPLSLGLVGMDTNAPKLISDFIRGTSRGLSDEDDTDE